MAWTDEDDGLATWSESGEIRILRDDVAGFSFSSPHSGSWLGILLTKSGRGWVASITLLQPEPSPWSLCWHAVQHPFSQLTLYFMFAVPTNLSLSPLPNKDSHRIRYFMATAPSHSIFLTFLLSLPSPGPHKLQVHKTCKLNFSKTVSDRAVGIRLGEALHKKLKTYYINIHWFIHGVSLRVSEDPVIPGKVRRAGEHGGLYWQLSGNWVASGLNLEGRKGTG